ncbi:hypothetical protein [Gordonia malaquae]|uniref:Uncharacterized protein n=1 Tax=Gordonia malaquae NBRC 108250 TaxID=1223542 RepID=M3UYZ9_GORML|nr:hypothetical protein [Gordonia malaquae]GAC81162.1 hypothetical protein GM1_029_00650 [Gordonia malaquae NBRC 108250]
MAPRIRGLIAMPLFSDGHRQSSRADRYEEIADTEDLGLDYPLDVDNTDDLRR